MSLDQSIPEVGAYTMVLFKDGARNRKDLVVQVRERRVVMTGTSWSGGRLGDWGCEGMKENAMEVRFRWTDHHDYA